MGRGGFIVTARVETEMQFNELTRLVEVSVNKAIAEWAAIALAEVRNAETRVGDASEKRRVSPGVHLRDSFQVSTIKALTGFGGLSTADVVVWTANPNAIWQELGTRGRRRKSLKGGAGSPVRTGAVTANVNATEGNRGVAPLYFMRKGMRRAFPQGVALIQQAIAGLGAFGGGSTLVDTTSPSFFRSYHGKY